uniref:Protein yippee-like n=1 Tax=Elaeis guineensis var. tenera TaxID=51953 RepID=A0A6J0PJ53_ELAGV|nr:protein yippee-like isoform X1 [Elaeis guineensis]XP_019706342.1 protein yippee-like isoform X1 [Elaeis guineensis]XP_019706343.1 protein yippee-like isoform X1 [Elaeis guineensis]
MGRLFLIHLEGKIYSCKHCQTHLALYTDIMSKSFHCRHGKAYLFHKVFKAPNLLAFTEFQLVYRECHLSFLQICNRVNVTVGLKEDRMMMTGLHTVSDIFCVGCGSIVGWKYDAAHDKNQKYKEGKFILERFKVSGPDGSHYWVSHDPHVGGSDADDA